MFVSFHFDTLFSQEVVDVRMNMQPQIPQFSNRIENGVALDQNEQRYSLQSAQNALLQDHLDYLSSRY